MKLSEKDDSLAEIIRYHEETKHHYHRYARSAGYMDWENQPNPFRFYDQTAVVELPLLREDPRLTTYPAYHHLKNR